MVGMIKKKCSVKAKPKVSKSFPNLSASSMELQSLIRPQRPGLLTMVSVSAIFNPLQGKYKIIRWKSFEKLKREVNKEEEK